MALDVSAPWHRESYDRLLNDSLPALLSRRVPLAGYSVEPAGPEECRIRIAVQGPGGCIEAVHEPIPRPDESGLFLIRDSKIVVIPTAGSEHLDEAEIQCVGEQLDDFLEARVAEAPEGLSWDEPLLRSWLPLEHWFREFLTPPDRSWPGGDAEAPPPPSVQYLDDQNWLSRCEHLRRIMVLNRKDVIDPSHFGRVCPVMTPEGTNIGRVLALAVGAAIRDGRIIINDETPEAGLSVTASMIPFLEQDDPNRALMGANMMRQWEVPPEAEPAIVQTGNEPDLPGFWCGRNLLTAFVSWGGDTFEDGIVVSKSAATRLDFPHALEPGDKLSNRHGTKGVVSRILPDDQMPHMPDGTPVELVFSFLGCCTRLNFGQVREAALSRAARAEGAPAVVPPFAAPSDEELRRRLKGTGLPESGMEVLTLGRSGARLNRPSTVGWVYWGKLLHLAAHKLHGTVSPNRPGANLQRLLEYQVLRDAGAMESILETFNTRSAHRPDADSLASRVAAGPIQQADPPTPSFAEMVRRLAAAGIAAEFEGQRITFRFRSPAGPGLDLAEPIPHPWLPAQTLYRIGDLHDRPEYAAAAEASRRLARLSEGGAPQALRRDAVAALQNAAIRLLDGMMTDSPMATGAGPDFLSLGGRVLFSGRTVLAPGPKLAFDELGLPEELAWTLFAPLVAQRVGTPEAEARGKKAAKVLEEIMARSWVLLNRAPSVLPTSILAFRPVRTGDKAIRLHPLACRPMNADFDGDQAAVFLPITEAGQKEAAEKLSLAGHLRRTPELLDWMAPAMEGIWGLAELSRTPAGLKEVCELATIEIHAPEGFVTRSTVLKALRRVLARDGADKTLAVMGRLMSRGFDVAQGSGASVSPFVKTGMELPAPPRDQDDPAWIAYEERIAELISSRTDFDSPDLGPQLLAVKSGARGNVSQLRMLLGGSRLFDPHGPITLVAPGGAITGVPHGLAEGLTPQEYFTRCIGARRGLAQVAIGTTREAYGVRQSGRTEGFTVLARAMRSRRPGVVFAHAAAIGEVDPLTDLDSRLFVGLRP